MEDVNVQLATERRKEQRFQVLDRAIAILNIGSNSVRLGKIVDVSYSGLAFDYLHLDAKVPKKKLDDEVGELSLNILTEDGCMVLGGVGVRKVNVRSLPREDKVYVTIPTFRCGVHFDGLSSSQKEQLGDFLLRHAVHCA